MSYGVFRSFYRECESFRWTKVPRGAARDSAAAARERVTRFGLSIRFVEYTLGQIQILDGSVLRPLIILDRPLYQCTNTRMTRPIAPGWTYLAPQRSHGRVCVCMERGGREWGFKLGEVGCWVLGFGLSSIHPLGFMFPSTPLHVQGSGRNPEGVMRHV